MSEHDGMIAKRYAVALFEIAKEQNRVDRFEEELILFRDVINADDKLKHFFEHPKLDVDKKKDVIRETFASVLSEQTIHTLYLMFDHHREAVILDLIKQYVDLANEERGIAEATVYSVRPLSDRESSALSEVFAKRIGKKTLRIDNQIDADLIGGIKIRIGNRIYDGSVNGKLERIGRQLMSAKA